MQRRGLWVDITLLILAAGLFFLMLWLGNWQVQRLQWKNELITAVNSRAYGTPVSIPSGEITADDHQYLRVKVAGTFQHQAARRVKAVTELGLGNWLLVPLKANTGETIWINRGYIPPGVSETQIQKPEEEVFIAGLLRLSEPNGTLLETNDPANDRWVSRDIEALAKASRIRSATSFFIDAEHYGAAENWPRGGLTKVTFKNNHLSYAITWYFMAAMFLVAMIYVIREITAARRQSAFAKTL